MSSMKYLWETIRVNELCGFVVITVLILEIGEGLVNQIVETLCFSFLLLDSLFLLDLLLKKLDDVIDRFLFVHNSDNIQVESRTCQ